MFHFGYQFYLTLFTNDDLDIRSEILCRYLAVLEQTLRTTITNCISDNEIYDILYILFDKIHLKKDKIKEHADMIHFYLRSIENPKMNWNGYKVLGCVAAVIFSALKNSETAFDIFKFERNSVKNQFEKFGLIYVDDDQLDTMNRFDISFDYLKHSVFFYNVRITKDTDANSTPLENIWSKLNTLYPEWFCKDVFTDYIPIELMRILQELLPKYGVLDEYSLLNDSERAIILTNSLFNSFIKIKLDNFSDEFYYNLYKGKEHLDKWKGSHKSFSDMNIDEKSIYLAHNIISDVCEHKAESHIHETRRLLKEQNSLIENWVHQKPKYEIDIEYERFKCALLRKSK